MMQSRHIMKLKPFVRTLGNASLAHIMADGCCGRLKMTQCTWGDTTHHYTAIYECVICGKTIESIHNKPGWQNG